MDVYGNEILLYFWSMVNSMLLFYSRHAAKMPQFCSDQREENGTQLRS
jgi:hypothetical protein